METLTTTIEWHLAEKELPGKSGEYLTVTDGGTIGNTSFSEKHQRFCCRDWYGKKEIKKIGTYKAVYWAEIPDCFSWDSLREYREGE